MKIENISRANELSFQRGRLLELLDSCEGKVKVAEINLVTENDRIETVNLVNTFKFTGDDIATAVQSTIKGLAREKLIRLEQELVELGVEISE